MYLISDKLVELVEKHSDQIISRWVERLKIDPTTSSYHQNTEFLGEKAERILRQLGRWVSYDTPKDEVGKRYAADGIELFKMHVPLCEAVRAMYLLRRTLWLFVENESAFNTAIEMHQMKELNDRVILFFDRAEYYLIRGYMEEMNRKIKDTWSLNADETEKIFFCRSFYKQ
jgi:hypothetical protein